MTSLNHSLRTLAEEDCLGLNMYIINTYVTYVYIYIYSNTSPKPQVIFEEIPAIDPLIDPI